jgi:hypothetical protein
VQPNTTVLEQPETQLPSTTTSLTAPSSESSNSCWEQLTVELKHHGGPQILKELKQGDLSEPVCLNILAAFRIQNANGPIALNHVDSPPEEPVLRPVMIPIATPPFDPYTRIHQSEASRVIPGSATPIPTIASFTESPRMIFGTETQLNKAPVLSELYGHVDPTAMVTGRGDFVDIRVIPDGALVGSRTFHAGAPPIVTLGKTLSLDQGGHLFVDNIQASLFGQPAESPSASVFRIGGQALTGTFVASSSGENPALVFNTLTLRPGSKTTYGGHTLSLASNGVLFDGATPATTMTGTTATTMPAPPHSGTTEMTDTPDSTTTKKKKSRGARSFAAPPESLIFIISVVGTGLITMIGRRAVL